MFLNTYLYLECNVSLIADLFTYTFNILLPPEWMGKFVCADVTYVSMDHFSTEHNKLSLIIKYNIASDKPAL